VTRPVSIVVPALADRDLFERALPPLYAERDRRGLDDEIVVVDDTGEGTLAAWLAEEHPACRVVARDANRGFARALFSGIEAARHELVFSMNPDVVVRPGFVDPLVACMDDDEVFAVAPRVLLNGEEDAVESVTALAFVDGLASIDQPGLAEGARPWLGRPRPVAFAVGGTCLLRRSELIERGGLDPLYEPFYWEDLDLCWEAWRAGRRVLYQPASVVEHHHRGSIGKLVEPDFVRAAIEKNRLLFQWKHLDGDAVRDHVAALYRLAIDAWLGDLREELVWVVLALEQLDEALASRGKLPAAKRTFEEIRRASDPRGESRE